MFERIDAQINPHVSVDCVILGFDGEHLKVLVIERNAGTENIEDDTLVLPGDLIRENENLEDAANRVLKELVGLENIYLEQIGAFGRTDRLNKAKDQKWLKAVRRIPKARVITIGYFALINIGDYHLTPSGFARNAEWLELGHIGQLGFDHNDILNSAIEKLRSELYRKPIGFELLPSKFTLYQIQTLYECILDIKLDKRNFRRKILKSGFLIETEKMQTAVAHKPAKLYKFNKPKFQKNRDDFSSFY